MRFLSKTFPMAVAALLATSIDFADAGSVHVYTPPASHITVHHAYTIGQAPHHGFFGKFFYILFGVSDSYDGPQPAGTRASLTEAQMLGYPQFTTIPSEAERYRLATGRSLPASHGLIVLPPTTPKGDETYIWPTDH